MFVILTTRLVGLNLIVLGCGENISGNVKLIVDLDHLNIK